eukprot:1160760-Pelagomonas_calceolata.AAC.15
MAPAHSSGCAAAPDTLAAVSGPPAAVAAAAAAAVARAIEVASWQRAASRACQQHVVQEGGSAR